MKKAIALVLSIVMTAALAIGGTLAYLTDTDEDVNVMTLGQVKIDQLEYERVDVESADDEAEVQEFHDNKPLYPAVTDKNFDYEAGDSFVDWDQIGKDNYISEIWDPSKINNEVDKMVFVKNKGDWDAYVRTVFAFEAGSYTDLDAYLADVHLNLNDTDWTWEWVETPITIGEGTYFVATATYNKVLEPGKLTEISLSQIALDSSVTNEDVAGFGDTFQVLVNSQAVQTAGFADAPTALEEAFGEIPPQYPFEDDNAIKGSDMFTAVNYYEGKSITSKVQSIVFGNTADYAAIADNNKGVLVDVEQDVPVYAYYVEDGGLYNIYLLASDTIYLPKDATKLFNGMSNMTTMVVDNLSTERTTTFKGLFQNCNKLQSLDVSEWDTSNVNDMIAAFNNCNALVLTGYEEWDTSKVTNMAMLFQNCATPTELDLSGWDVSSVTTMNAMFNGCTNMTGLDTTGWDMGNVTDCNGTFNNCKKLVAIDGIEAWDTGSVTDMDHMFYGCEKLENPEISQWDVSNVKKLRYMFAHAKSITELDLSDWDVSSVTDLASMFYNCVNLETLDVADWDTGNVQRFNHMFASASQNASNMKLKNIDVSKWDTSSAVVMYSMFYGCGALTALDLGAWDVSHVESMSHMFADCSSLVDLNLVGWDTSGLVTMDAIFNDCESLVTIDVSTFKTQNVREFCQVFEACDNLVSIVGLENWDTSSGRVFEEMFSGCSSLKELNLSAFDTSNATKQFKTYHGSTYRGFASMFSGLSSLEELTLGEGIVFLGDGTAAKMALPNPAGSGASWYNAENGTYYAASEIPEKTAATYVAAVKP